MMVANIAACSPPLPTPTPTQTPPPPSAIDEVMAELFWMSVDWFGHAAGAPEVNPTLGFEEAKCTAREFLFHLVVLEVEDLTEAGFAGGETLPHCRYVMSARLHLVPKITATTPSQAATTSKRR